MYQPLLLSFHLSLYQIFNQFLVCSKNKTEENYDLNLSNRLGINYRMYNWRIFRIRVNFLWVFNWKCLNLCLMFGCFSDSQRFSRTIISTFRFECVQNLMILDQTLKLYWNLLEYFAIIITILLYLCLLLKDILWKFVKYSNIIVYNEF